MSKKLPAQVRMHIRDLIDAPESEVQQALDALNKAIGSHFKLEIAWEDILRDLKLFFPDELDKLVPSVGRHITIFLNRLELLLEQDEDFQEIFLEQYTGLLPILNIVIQAGLKTTCKNVNRRITLLLPTAGEEGFRYAQSSVGSDIPNLFKDEGEDEVPAAFPTSAAHIEEDQDWDTFNIVPIKTETHNSKQDARNSLKFQDTASIKPRPLPKLKALQRPEVLFSDLLPAFLVIKGSEQEVFVEGSHAPTITLIAEYFKNYTRKDMSDGNQSPRFRVEESTSNFGSGTMSDCIHIQLWHRNREWRINVALLLSFIEGVCSYQLVDCKSGSYTYKRTIPF